MAIYTNKVANMVQMFYNAEKFNHDINDWNTAQVANRLSKPTASRNKSRDRLDILRSSWRLGLKGKPESIGIHTFQKLFSFANATHVRSAKSRCRSPLGPSDLDLVSGSAFDWSTANI